MIVDMAAMALFDHWQRNVGDSARLDWVTITPGLRGVFYGQAEAVLSFMAIVD